MDNKRLSELASHLDAIENIPPPNILEVWIEWPENNLHSWIAVKYNASLFIDMTKWFEGWRLSEHFQEPELNEFENLGFAGSCLKFFSFSPKEFSHLFDTEGYQNIQEFGGEYLSKFSSPSAIAFNIRELIKKSN